MAWSPKINTEIKKYAPSVIVPMVTAMVKPQRVCDWGCNNGVWLHYFGKELPVKHVHGYDMLPWSEEMMVAEENYEQVDFEKEIPIHECDLAVNLENAEHLSSGRAETLVDSLTFSAPVVLFSAATPGQGGENHINEQHHSYWHHKFALRGFMFFDAIRWAVRDDHRVFPWYRNNMFIYSSVPFPISSPLSV